MSWRGRPMVLLLPLVWLAVVLAVAGLTWRVIDSTGRQLLTSGEGSTLSPSGTAGSPRTPGPPEPRRHQADAGRSATPSQEPAASSSPRSTKTGPATSLPSEPSEGSGEQPSPQPVQPSAQPATPQPTTAPTDEPSQPSQPTAAETQVRSWQGAAGTVTAGCSNARITLQSVTPNDGWRVEVGDRGPEHIEVTFRSGGEEERETQVEAVCAAGAPRFQVEADD